MRHSEKIKKLIERYRMHLIKAGLVAVLIELCGVMFGPFRLIGLDYDGSWIITVLSLSLIPFFILVYWEMHATSGMIQHLVKRMRLDQNGISEFEQAMGLLNQTHSQTTELTLQLQDRALTRWVDSLTRICHAAPKLISLLLIQTALMVLLVVLCQMQLPIINTESFHLPLEDVQAISPSSDIQNQTPPFDQVAHDLLALRNLLMQADDMMTDVQWDDLLQQINALWQSIKTQWQAMASQSDAQMLSLQSDANLPVTTKVSLQSSSWRQTAMASITSDIKALARRGANFDGPGVLSTGQSTTQADDAATTARGLYHEYQLQQDATSNDAQRRLQTVPPAYRQAVGAYLMGSQDPNVKGP